MAKRMLWRYWFHMPVKGKDYVDRPFAPCPRISQPGGSDFVMANVPYQSNSNPVHIPWENIKYVEEVEEPDE